MNPTHPPHPPARPGSAPPQTVLVTGGAGFIGSFVVDRLLAEGHDVRVLDRLDPQIHGEGGQVPEYLNPAADLTVADLEDRDAVRRVLNGVDRVIHLAAAVGVGQSMYEVVHYTRSNELGTAVLLEEMINQTRRPASLVVASSMSIYGEGVYEDAEGRRVTGVQRDAADLQADRWEPLDGEGRPLTALPTPEDKPTDCSSIYALGKHWQERATLITANAYGIPATALRFFNVYGPRQALSNPYTGVMAIFASRLLNGNRPKVFEDGRQQRDFVSVHDVADAVVAASFSEAALPPVLNIGSGQRVTVVELAEKLAAILGRPDLTPEITGTFRLGDIRHCFADVSAAEDALGFRPRVTLEAGVAELAGWLKTQTAADHVDAASAELAARGLTV